MMSNDKVSSWLRIHAAANRAVGERFYRLGYWVATHPKLTLLLNLAFVALCSIGFVNFKVVTDGERLVDCGLFVSVLYEPDVASSESTVLGHIIRVKRCLLL